MNIKLIDEFMVSVEHLEKQKVVFKGLYYKSNLLTKEWTEAYSLVEVFSNYTKNQLHMDDIYSIAGIEFELFKNNKNIVMLAMYCNEEWSYYKKLSASTLFNLLNKVLSRCDLLHNEHK